MRLVSGSSSQYSSRSFDETSALLPIETNDERPSPRPSAASRSASPSAPLWDETATFPGGSALGPNVAFSRAADTAMPRQLGPTSLAPCARVTASNSSCLRSPSAPTSAKPAEITQSAFVPARSASSAASSTCSPATQITARSIESSISAIDWYARTPATGSPLRLTGYAMPAKPASSTFRYSSPPIEPRRDEAPTTATVRGVKNGASDAATATWSRSSTCATYVPVGSMSRRTSISPPSIWRVSRKPASSKTRSIGRFPAITSAMNCSMPGACRKLGELLEQTRSHAVALELVGDREGDLGRRRVPETDVARKRDDARCPPPRPASRRAIRARSSPARETARRARAQATGSRGSAGRRSRLTTPRRTPAQQARPACAGGRRRSVLPSRRMTSRTGSIVIAMVPLSSELRRQASGDPLRFLRETTDACVRLAHGFRLEQWPPTMP